MLCIELREKKNTIYRGSLEYEKLLQGFLQGVKVGNHWPNLLILGPLLFSQPHKNSFSYSSCFFLQLSSFSLCGLRHFGTDVLT